MKRIAVVDDDEGFLDFLRTLLEHQGHTVEVFPSAGRFLDSLMRAPPDMAVLDLNLPGVSGWEIIRLLKEMESTRGVPLIAVSGEFDTSEHVVRALGLGADEFFRKPIDADVFAAQVAALFRRAGAAPAPDDDHSHRIVLENVSLDAAEHIVRVDDNPVHFTPLEFDLLAHLMRNPNRVLTRGHILQHVWKSDPSQSTRTVDKRVESLRKKLGAFGRTIQTVSGVGYCLRTG